MILSIAFWEMLIRRANMLDWSGFCVVLRLTGFVFDQLEKAVRAWRECPHLRIEIWGTRLAPYAEGEMGGVTFL